MLLVTESARQSLDLLTNMLSITILITAVCLCVCVITKVQKIAAECVGHHELHVRGFAGEIFKQNRNKKFSCRRQTARTFVSLNILLIHSRSLRVIRNDLLEKGISPY